MKDIARELLINMSKRAMLENIHSLSKDRLQSELRLALEDKWKLQDEIERLNKVLKYLEIYFSNRENYELAQIVRDTKEANIEWLDKAINRLKGIDLTEKDKRQIRWLKEEFKIGDKE